MKEIVMAHPWLFIGLTFVSATALSAAVMFSARDLWVHIRTSGSK